jgi:hypothetical protein
VVKPLGVGIEFLGWIGQANRFRRSGSGIQSMEFSMILVILDQQGSKNTEKGAMVE